MSEPAFTILNDLPHGHVLRGIRLSAIGAEVLADKKGAQWTPITAWRIGRNSFNDLSDPWTTLYRFRVSGTVEEWKAALSAPGVKNLKNPD